MLSEKLINASGAPTANWDLSYATYSGTGIGQFRLTPQTTRVTDLVFSTDGTKMYVLNSTAATIYQYSMPTAFDIGAAVYDSKSKTISAQETTPTSFAFSTDGTKMYAVGNSSYVRYYTLSTPWDVSTATYVAFMNPAVDSQLGGIWFKPDGTIMYLTGDQNNRVYSIALSTAWDISSFSTDINGNPVRKFFILSGQSTSPKKVFLKSDGTKMYMITQASLSYEYTLSTAWDVSTATYSSITGSSGYQGITFTTDGSYLIHGQWSSGSYAYVKKSAVSTAWSLPLNYSLADISSENGKYVVTYNGVYFKSDGSTAYFCFTNRVDQRSLSTPWNISTINDSPTVYYTSPSTTNESLFFKPDGAKVYIYSSFDRKINQYSLSTPWSVSTMSFETSYLTPELSPTALFLNNTGTKLFFSGNTDDKIYEYSLSTPWDVSTASSVTSFNFSTPGNPSGFCFKDDGSKIYIISSTNNQIYEYRLWINWSFSGGATLLSTYNASSAIETPKNITFDSAGSNLYVLDASQIATILKRIRVQ